MKKYTDVKSYIADFPKETQKILLQLRAVIKKEIPDATEAILYGMPAYKKNGPVIYFGGFKDHVSIFPTPSAIIKFQKELRVYKISKGTIQFPLDTSLPTALIRKIIAFKIKENQSKMKSR